MSIAVLVLKLAKEVPILENADYIGVDAGTLVCLQQNIPMKYAVGDFDSVTQEEWAIIQKQVPNIEKLNPIKDDSDSEHALKEAVQQGYDTIYVYGALGGRIDHEIVNIRLAYRYPGKVYLVSDKNLLYVVEEGTYTFEKKQKEFLSFFTEEEACITLKGFSYDIEHRTITHKDTYTVSNEVKEEQGTLIVEKGKVCIVHSHD